MSNHRRNHLLDVAHLACSRDDNRSGCEHFLIAIFLCHRETVLACGDVDSECAGKIATTLHRAVECCVLPFVAAGPHPVGAERYALEPLGERRSHDVGERFCNREHRTVSGIGESGLRSMSNRGGDTCFPLVVESNHTAVAERQLNLALALLASHLTCDRAVHLVGEPVFTSYSLDLQYIINIFLNIFVAIFGVGIGAFHGFIHHYGFGRIAKHVSHFEVDRLNAIGLLKHKSVVAGGFTHNIEWRTLTVGDLSHPIDVFFFHDHTHALLRLVAHNFLGRKGGVANRKCPHLYFAAGFLNEFGKGVEVSACAVVVDRDNRVVFAFAHGANHICNTFLHFGVGALHGIKLYAVVVLPGVHRRHSAATHTDAVVVAAHEHHFLPRLRSAFDGIAACCVSYTAGEHNHLVIAILHSVFFVLESEE